MVRKIDWDSQIGRRLKLRDLHVFSMVVECGSMAKAAQHLGVSPPAVSEVIAGLEHELGVPLLDRVAQGIEPTIYGGALLKRSIVVFDELKQGIRDLEFLSDATTGEVRIGCTEALRYTLLPEIILRFSEQYPRVDVHADLTGNLWVPGPRERKYDCVLYRSSPLQELAIDELNVELLPGDMAIIAAGANSRWARRRTIDLAELTDEAWALGAPDTWHGKQAEQIFRARGLDMPKPKVAAMSITLRAHLIAGGPYLTMFATSVLRQLIADHYAVVALPVDLPSNPSWAGIVTVKNRTLSPVVERFLACVREVAASLDGKQESQAALSSKSQVSAPSGARLNQTD
jgi:DNA-binding transcriptional LysR family regulator